MQGQLLTREGLTLTEDPEVFQLLGVYVVATGQLHAKVEPASGPVTVALADNETTVHPAAYRWIPSPPAVHTRNALVTRCQTGAILGNLSFSCELVCVAW